VPETYPLGSLPISKKNELALIATVLAGKLECDQGGDIFTTILWKAGDEAAGCVEVNGASGGGVLRGIVGKDGCNGLLSLRLSVTVTAGGIGGSRGAGRAPWRASCRCCCCICAVIIIRIAIGFAASGERSGGAKGGNAEETSNDGLSVHVDSVVT